jgi:hypothetical protein
VNILPSMFSNIKDSSPMARTTNISKNLRKIISSLEDLVTSIEAQGSQPTAKGKNGKAATGRTRRSKKDVAALKKLLKAERKAGVPVTKLAQQHGVSTAYIYMLG